MSGANGPAADRGTERNYHICLCLVPGIGPRRLASLVARFGSAREAWEAPEDALEACPGLPAPARAALVARRREVDPTSIVETLAHAGTVAVTTLDDEYPPDLRSIADCPPVLFIQGGTGWLKAPAIAVVGTRKPSPYGLEVTAGLAADIARAGVLVVSGLALGIDTAAHRAAVETGGRTVAVLGSGLDHLYPERNAGLAARIRATGGAVISQFAADTLPTKGTFLARNRVVAGLVKGVVVTEAPAGSGALSTAGFAREFGRPVMVVPGPVTSRNFDGCLGLLREGARAVATGKQVLEDTGLGHLSPGGSERLAPAGAGRAAISGGPPPKVSPRVSGDAGAVLAVLHPGETVGFAVLMARTGLDADRLGSALGLLEIRGLVSRQPGQCYTRG